MEDIITYEYYPAYKPDGSAKEGINRIVFINGVESTREYCPVDPRGEPIEIVKQLQEASAQDIQQLKILLGIK
jgi:hypothetical protein